MFQRIFKAKSIDEAVYQKPTIEYVIKHSIEMYFRDRLNSVDILIPGVVERLVKSSLNTSEEVALLWEYKKVTHQAISSVLDFILNPLTPITVINSIFAINEEYILYPLFFTHADPLRYDIFEQLVLRIEESPNKLIVIGLDKTRKHNLLEELMKREEAAEYLTKLPNIPKEIITYMRAQFSLESKEDLDTLPDSFIPEMYFLFVKS